jgi:hypothetical protein
VLSVCEVTADEHPPKGMQVVEQRLDATMIGNAKALSVFSSGSPRFPKVTTRVQGDQ